VADGCGQRGRHADHVEIHGEARGLHACDEIGEAGHVVDGVQWRRSLLRGAQRLHGGPQLGERLGRGGRYLIQGRGLALAGLTLAARSGRSLDVDGHQRMPDDVVDFVGQREALLVEAMLRRGLALACRVLGQRAAELLPGAKCLAGEESAQHQRRVGDDVDWADSGAGDEHCGSHDRRHQRTHHQGPGPASLEPHREHQQHGDADRSPVRVEDGKARQQQR